MKYLDYISKVDDLVIGKHQTGYFYLDPMYRYIIQKNNLTINDINSGEDPIQDFDGVTDQMVSEQLKLQVQWLDKATNNGKQLYDGIMFLIRAIVQQLRETKDQESQRQISEQVQNEFTQQDLDDE